MTNAEKILALLSRNPGLDDDEISSHANIRPRQQVNQICRLLESRGQIKRTRGPRGKVVNYLTGKVPDHAHEPPVASSPTQIAADFSARRHYPRETRKPRVESSELDELSSLDLTNTLVLIPCSGSKAHGSGPVQGPSIMEYLSKTLGEELTSARAKVAEKSRLDDSALMPAWLRYTGTLYHSAQPALQTAVNQGQKLAILSGGYGLVLATEPIGYYERVFKYSDWPRGLLERVLLQYVRANEIQNVVAFVSATTGYRDLLNRVDWTAAELKTVSFVMPESVRGAMVKAPRAQGEALSALLQGKLDADFLSSDGLQMELQRVVVD